MRFSEDSFDGKISLLMDLNEILAELLENDAKLGTLIKIEKDFLEKYLNLSEEIVEKICQEKSFGW